MTFPIDRRNERSFEPGWSGEVFICDIDRTYLATRFSTLKGLARIPFEFAIDKQDIEGMVALLKEVRRGPGRDSRQTPLYFISASPAQLRKVIERKMLLDGLEFDGTTFKDWVAVLSGLRLKRMKEQLGFKLTALLVGRRELPDGVQETLLGDDLETDPLAFTLYADLLAGRVEGEQLQRVLTRQGVAYDDARSIGELALEARGRGGVRRAYVRMERHGAAEAFLDASPGLVGCRGALQIAIGLWDQGSLARAGVVRVAHDLAQRRWSPESIGDRLRDCSRRALLPRERAEELRAALVGEGIIPAAMELPPAERAWELARQREDGRPWTPLRYL